MQRFIIFMRTKQNQIFDDDIDYKCYVTNLLRFFNNDIARESDWSKIQVILLYWIVENPDYLKMKRNNKKVI